MGKRRDIEGPIHRACIEYLEVALPGAVVHHSPNELPIRGPAAKRAMAKAKWNGMQPGYPDIILHFEGVTVLFEVKAEGGRLSDSQKAMRAALKAQGIPYFEVRSKEDVRESLGELGIQTREVSS